MKLRFVIDKKYDISIALQTNSSLSLEYLKEQYKKRMPDILIKKKAYQKSWDGINDEFSGYVENVTGYKWFYPEYLCVLSFANRGVSNWGGEPKIIRSYEEDPYKMRRITAHELIISHYFEIYRRYYAVESLRDGQVWALAEIAAYALTSLTKNVKAFWPNTKYYIWYTKHTYPQIVDLRKKLKNEFVADLKKKNFDDYIERGIKLVREYPKMSP